MPAAGTRTITQAIAAVMRQSDRPLTIGDVYDSILSQGLYQFKSDNPAHMVRNAIRRHCLNLDFSSASAIKFFEIKEPGKYSLLQKPIKKGAAKVAARTGSRAINYEVLKRDHARFARNFKDRVIQQLLALSPQDFERFCRNLLRAYGFRKVRVTRVSKDGGIDGFGQLKVGFAYFNVAFQCKRWRTSVGRPDISQFRGDVQGGYEMGIFFTTSSFTPEAKANSLKTGAVPITLIDGKTIVDIMLDRNFGVEKEQLSIYKLALDLALAEDYQETL